MTTTTEEKIVYEGFTHQQLTDALNKVIKKGDHWKDPIYSRVNKKDIPATEAAISYICGSPCEYWQHRTKGGHTYWMISASATNSVGAQLWLNPMKPSMN